METMKKLIELDAALDALEGIDCSDGVGISTLKCDTVNDAITVIKALPTVDAVPVRHGRWIYEERDRLDHETDDGRVFRTEKWWKCSECGNAKGYIGHKPSDKFCSKCGADMREDGDGNG